MEHHSLLHAGAPDHGGSSLRCTFRGALYTRSVVLEGFSAFIAHYGHDCSALLQEAGISPDMLGVTNRFISSESYSHFVELAAQRCNAPNFGLEHSLSLPKTYPNSGPITLLAQFCTSLRDWMEKAFHYAPMYTNAWKPFLEENGKGDALFRLLENPLHVMPRHHAEGLMATLMFIVQEIVQRPDLRPSIVRFRHAAPDGLDLHRKVFGCRLEFNAPHNEFVFDAAMLDLPIDGKLSKLVWLMDFYVRREIRLAISHHGTISRTVAAAIPAVLGTELCTAAGVATSLGLSEKKMQRLLREEGTTFSNILFAVRRNLAETLLASSTMPIETIAAVLGYAAPAAFTLAFTNWTGRSPITFRREAF